MRRRARSSLIGFASSIEIPGKPVDPDIDELGEGGQGWVFQPIETGFARHHLHIMSETDALVKGELHTREGEPILNMMLFAPPGSAKSTYTSVVLPPYIMGLIAQSRTILASYAMGIARKQGRRARSIAKQRRYRAIWKCQLSDESAAAHEWATTNGSEFMASGLTGGITGNRADVGIIDDPVAGREEADSEVSQKNTREAYEDDFLTRLKPGAKQILMQTRWNQADLAGTILPEDWHGESGDFVCRDGQIWRVGCMPAEAMENDVLGRKPGEILWPEWFTPEHFARYKGSARRWSSLFQQIPTPGEGIFFLREWFKHHDHLPPLETLKIYIGSDYAVTADGGDWTVHVVIGVDPLGELWLVDLWREQSTSDRWVEAYCDLLERYRPSQTAEETGQISAGVGPFLIRRMRARKVSTWRRMFPTRGDKAVRAQSIRGMMAMQGLNVVRNMPGLTEFINELLAFNAGRNDDQVDALALVGQLLDLIMSGKEPVGQGDDPKTLEYVGTPDGRTVSNMTISQQIDDFLKRRKAKRED